MAATWGCYSSIGKCRILCRWVHWISNFHVRVWPRSSEAHCYQMQSGLGREGGRAGPRPSLVEKSQTLSLIGCWPQWAPADMISGGRCRSQPLSLKVTLSALSLSSLHSGRQQPAANTRYQIFKRLSRVFTLSRDWMVTSHSIINTQCIKFLGQSRLVNDSQI